jgi:hypothetical protein
VRIEQKDQAWRRKPSFDVEECYTQTRDGLSRGIRYIIKGPHQYEDEERVLKGLVCANCMEPFPAKPGPDTLQLFIDSNLRYPHDQHVWHRLVRQGRCPMCAEEVSYEYANLMHEGTLPKPGWMQE